MIRNPLKMKGPLCLWESSPMEVSESEEGKQARALLEESIRQAKRKQTEQLEPY